MQSLNWAFRPATWGNLVDMSRGHAPEWVGQIGTTLYLVRAGSPTAAREKVAEMANGRASQRGLLFDPIEVEVRRAKPGDLLAFAEAGLTAFEFEPSEVA